MMIRIYQWGLLLGLIVLVIMGLNTSMQGLNSLTLNNEKPVLGWQATDTHIDIYTWGESHSYKKQEIAENICNMEEQVSEYAHTGAEYGKIIRMVLSVLLFA